MPSPSNALSLSGRKRSADRFARVLHTLAGQARELVSGSKAVAPNATHDVRLLVKRSRALAWFARPMLTKKVSAGLKPKLRQASRLLSGERDEQAARTTLRKLEKSADEPRFKPMLQRALKQLGPPRANGQTRKLRRAVGVLYDAVEAFARAVEARDRWVAPDQRLAKATYAVGKAGEAALREGADEDFHNWRKKAKRLLFLLELRKAKPKGRDKKLRVAVDELQSTLGDDHDCVVTAAKFPRTRPGANYVRDLLYRRQTKLRKSAAKSARAVRKLR